jgi:hypothetical protein
MSDDATLTQPNPIKIRWFFGVFAAFLVFVLIAAYSSRMANDTPAYDQQRAAERLATLKKLQEDDQKTLTTADWIDQTKGTIRIPIDEALPETVADLKSKPVQMGAAIPGAAPQTPNTLPAAAANSAPAGAPNAPSTNAAPSAPTTPSPDAPNK